MPFVADVPTYNNLLRSLTHHHGALASSRDRRRRGRRRPHAGAGRLGGPPRQPHLREHQLALARQDLRALNHSGESLSRAIAAVLQHWGWFVVAVFPRSLSTWGTLW